ncbi:MAG: flavodoxin domain-containing protein, partial [Pseudonocardia sediminis]
MTHTDRPGAASRPAPAVLIACTTRDTCTVATSARLADELRRLGVVVDVAPAEGIETLGGYRGVVLGGTLRAGRWPRTGRRFLDRHGAVLSGLPVWIFEYPATNPGRAPGPRLTDALGGPITLGVTPGGGSVIGPLVRFGAEVP